MADAPQQTIDEHCMHAYIHIGAFNGQLEVHLRARILSGVEADR